MTSFLRLFGLAMTTTVLVLCVKKQAPELGMLLSAAGCVLAGLLLLARITPLLDLIRELGEKAGLEPAMTAPLLKVLGLGLLTTVSASVCADAGQSAMARLLELGGGLLCLLVSLPLLRAVLDLLEDLL